MHGYSQAIYALSSAHRSKADVVEVTSLAAWLLPNFLAVVFSVTLLQVLFLSAGSPRLFHDSDTGWHVRNGEAILSNSSIPQVDPFSYTRGGEPWFSWEWLSDAALGASYRFGGLSGVALITTAAIALAAFGAAHLALSLGGNLFFAAGGTVLLLGVTSMHWLARPHVFSWILALAFLSVAEHERRRPTRLISMLPVLAALWTNMHASFLLGPAILFIYAVGEWIARRSAGRFLTVSFFSLLATFVNPYGWRLHEHVFAYLQNGYLMDHIEEFRSFNFHGAGALYVESFLAVAVLGTVALFRQRAFGPALLCLAMLHLSLYSARHLPTAAVLLLPLSIAALTSEAKEWEGLKRFFEYSERLRAIDRRIYGIVPISIVLMMAVFGVSAQANSGRVGFDTGTFPVHGADFLERKFVDQDALGRVFATDQWGGYLIYRFGGRLKVFIDGRSDFYGRDVLETYAQVIAIKPGWDSVLNQYHVRFVLVPTGSPLASILQMRTDWKPVYSDRVSALYERAG
jgi:hypothetical protein